ncbi:MAG: hypothetical protein HDQ96_13900 [Lachnospiraceae bacterium]|nr:hypothetical protein [Lachnospiraceae bacterium]
MIAFFCSTPYQIFSVVSIMWQYYREEETDLFILDFFSGSDKYAEHIRTLGLFSNVFHINGCKRSDRILKDVKYPEKDFWKIRMRISHAFWKLYYYGRYAAELKKDHIEPEKYSAVFFANGDPVSNIIGIYIKRKRLHILQYGFEDGGVDYIVELDKKYRKMHKLERIMGVPENVYHKDKYWIYRPDQIYNRSKYVSKIERIFPPDDEVKALILKIWDIGKTSYIPRRYLFLDNFLEWEEMHRIVDSILEIVGKDNFTFKPHPRRMDKLFADNQVEIWPASDIPFEAYLAARNYNNNVIISWYSTACFTPKFIYGQEPIIIFIYRIVNTSPINYGIEEVDLMVNKLISAYEHKERIYIPNDINELRQIIEQINT